MVEQTRQQAGWRHWKRCRVFLYLVGVLLAVDALVARYAHIWRAYDPQFYRERLQYCRRQAWDLVVVGGSPAMAGIDVGILQGLHWQGQVLSRALNLGLPLGTTAEVRRSVEQGLVAPPRLVVYGITASDLNDDRVEPQGARYLMGVNDVMEWCLGRPDAAGWCIRNYTREHIGRLWQLFYYREGMRRWANEQLDLLWPGLCPEADVEARGGLLHSHALHTDRGSLPAPVVPAYRLDMLKASAKTMPAFPFLNHFRIKGYLADLQRLLDWADRQHVAMVLVDMPVSADLEQRLHPQEYATYRATLAEVERDRGVRVLRPTRAAVGLTDADFSDLIHLNANGTARFSAWLRRALQSLPETQPPAHG